MGGGKSQPSILRGIALLIVCALVCACSSSNSDTSTPEPNQDILIPVRMDNSLYYNPDSLLHYAELAYLHDDPQGLYITGSAAYLRTQDPNFPDSCTTVPLDEADIMLLRSAELGCDDACRMIHSLELMDLWNHSIPE